MNIKKKLIKVTEFVKNYKLKKKRRKKILPVPHQKVKNVHYW